MDIRSQGFSSMEQVRSSITSKSGKTGGSQGVSTAPENSFQSIFQEASDTVKFSKHASERMVTRKITMTDSQKARLEDAANQATEKGMKESLVMVDDMAFILNVKNKTVVTAVDDMKQGVFTNIDGAIIN